MINRRTLLVSAAAAAAFAQARAAAQEGGTGARVWPRGPTARIEPVTETFFGQSVTDPYRWMENPADPDWEPFMRANADHARAMLDAIPGRAGLQARNNALTGAFDAVFRVSRNGGKQFFTKRVAGADSPALFVREDGADRVLIDPNTMEENGAHVSLDWWEPSPNGAHVVYGLSPAGSENSVLHIMEVATGTVLPERIDRTQYASPTWLPDGSGFFYNRLQGAELGTIDYYLNSKCWLHRLGQPGESDVVALSRGQYAEIEAAETDFPFLYCNGSSPYVIGILFGGVRRENPAWVARLDDLLAGRPRWRTVCAVEDEVVGLDLNGQSLFLLTTKDAENAKVLKTSARRPNLARAQLMVPESEVVIDGMAAAADGLYVLDMDGGYSRLRKRGYGRGAETTVIPLPFEGSLSIADYDPTEPGLMATLTSWLEPTGFYIYEPANGTMTNTGLAPRPPIDTSPYEAIRTFATARDGTQVPLSIIKRKDISLDGSHPTLLEAYGAYQIVSAPGFWTRGFAFLEAGGILATAHVRGGGEYGKRWWRAGRKLTKPNTWRDMIDCAEHLIRAGYTSSAKLAINGGSAGGITVGRALTERPDLFCAVIPAVGVLNALRAEFSQNGPPNIEEFGTVTEEDGFRGLYEMDALHHVRDGQRYPAVMLTHGMTDPRVEPWHSGKMVARLRAADPDGGPFLLRVDFEAGHGLGSTRSQLDAEWADVFAFVLWRAGQAGYQPA